MERVKVGRKSSGERSVLFGYIGFQLYGLSTLTEYGGSWTGRLAEHNGEGDSGCSS